MVSCLVCCCGSSSESEDAASRALLDKTDKKNGSHTGDVARGTKNHSTDGCSSPTICPMKKTKRNQKRRKTSLSSSPRRGFVDPKDLQGPKNSKGRFLGHDDDDDDDDQLSSKNNNTVVSTSSINSRVKRLDLVGAGLSRSRFSDAEYSKYAHIGVSAKETSPSAQLRESSSTAHAATEETHHRKRNGNDFSTEEVSGGSELPSATRSGGTRHGEEEEEESHGGRRSGAYSPKEDASLSSLSSSRHRSKQHLEVQSLHSHRSNYSTSTQHQLQQQGIDPSFDFFTPRAGSATYIAPVHTARLSRKIITTETESGGWAIRTARGNHGGEEDNNGDGVLERRSSISKTPRVVLASGGGGSAVASGGGTTTATAQQQQQQQHLTAANISLSGDSPQHSTGGALSPHSDNGGGDDPGTIMTTRQRRPSVQSVASARSSAALSLTDYSLVAIIGHGTFAEVSLARHRKNRTLFAIKKISKRRVREMGFQEQTTAERALLGKLRHPFLVGLRRAFQSTESLYLVLDFAQGGDFHTLLGKDKATRIPVHHLFFYAYEIALVLAYLHKNGFIYRDLKPENVLLKPSGHILLTDFGVAKDFSAAPNAAVAASAAGGGVVTPPVGADSPLSQSNANLDGSNSNNGIHKTFSFVGSAGYMPPEIIAGESHDFAADWWTYGCLLFEMINGRRPFHGRTEFMMYKHILACDIDEQEEDFTAFSDTRDGVESKKIGDGGSTLLLHPVVAGHDATRHAESLHSADTTVGSGQPDVSPPSFARCGTKTPSQRTPNNKNDAIEAGEGHTQSQEDVRSGAAVVETEEEEEEQGEVRALQKLKDFIGRLLVRNPAERLSATPSSSKESGTKQMTIFEHPFFADPYVLRKLHLGRVLEEAEKKGTGSSTDGGRENGDVEDHGDGAAATPRQERGAGNSPKTPTSDILKDLFLRKAVCPPFQPELDGDLDLRNFPSAVLATARTSARRRKSSLMGKEE